MSLIAVYIIGGFLYQRLIVGAKGMEQIPHFAFWQDLGNLVAVSKNSYVFSAWPMLGENGIDSVFWVGLPAGWSTLKQKKGVSLSFFSNRPFFNPC